MMDCTSINRLQRRNLRKRSAPAYRPRRDLGAGLWLIAALWFLGPGGSGQRFPGLGPRPAYAQDFAAAGQHFASAQDAFAQGKYEQAAKEFQAAYDITHDPSMLVNIGESWQRAGDGKKALSGYKAYLAAQPQAPDRSEIEGRIKAIESALTEAGATPGEKLAPAAPPTPPETDKPPGPPAADQTGQAPTVPPAVGPGLGLDKPNLPAATEPGKTPAAKIDGLDKPLVTPPEGPPSRLRTAGWVTVAVAIALATSGAIVGLGAQDRADELHRRTTLLIGNQPPVYDAGQAEAYTTLQSEGTAYNQASIALLSAAGAVAVTAAVLFIADYVRRPKAETKSKGSWALLPSLVPGAAAAGGHAGAVTGGLVASGSF